MSKSKPNEEPLDFEAALAELDEISRDLEGGTLGLDASLERYERGVGLLRRCYAKLEGAEQKIAQLVGFDAEGNAVTEPFDASATADQGVAGRRQTKAPKRKPAKASKAEEESSNDEEPPSRSQRPELF